MNGQLPINTPSCLASSDRWSQQFGSFSTTIRNAFGLVKDEDGRRGSFYTSRLLGLVLTGIMLAGLSVAEGHGKTRSTNNVANVALKPNKGGYTSGKERVSAKSPNNSVSVNTVAVDSLGQIVSAKASSQAEIGLATQKLKPITNKSGAYKALALATDTDSDGVDDSIDLDDDNDGILDTVENVCTYVSAPLSANGDLIWDRNLNPFPGKLESNSLPNVTTAASTISFGSGFASAVAFSAAWQMTGANATSFAQAKSLNEYVQVTIPTTASTTNYILTDWITYGIGGAYQNVGIEISTDPTFATSTLLYDGANPNTTGYGSHPLTTPFTMVSGTQYYVRAYPYGTLTTILWDVLGFNTYCSVDTDGDGIPNQLDTDSDNDGCSDAVEGGAVTFSVSGGQVNGTTGQITGAISSATATLGVPTLAGAGQTTGYSQSSAINGCLDNDNDGIANVDDLDDDNDGILDTAEGVSCINSFVWNINVYGDYTSNGQAGVVTTFTPPFLPVSPVIATAQYSGTNSLVANVNTTDDSKSFLTLLGATNYVGAIDTQHWLAEFTHVVRPGEEGTTTFSWGNVADILVLKKNSTVIFQGSYPTATAGSAAISYAVGDTIRVYVGENNSNNTWVNLSSNLPPTAKCDIDTDGDGIADRLDLDSDGDGCPDAIEGGAAFTTANLTPAGALTGTVSSASATLGIPTLAGAGQTTGYGQNSAINACIDTDNDGIADIDDLDDDNDGILDTAENGVCVVTPAPTSTSYVNSGNYSGLNAPQLTSSTAWAPVTASAGTFVGMKFASPSRIFGVTTKGRGDAAQWTTSYKLQGTKDGTTWVDIATYTGNTNQNTAVTNPVSDTAADWLGARIVPLT